MLPYCGPSVYKPPQMTNFYVYYLIYTYTLKDVFRLCLKS